jgi:hypothetical protein
MTDQTKATRATIQLGNLTIDGFMLPNGSYQMSLTQAAETVDLGVQNASDFLRSKALKSLAGEGYTPQTFEIETDDQTRGQGRFRGLPLEIVRKYWLYQASRGNKKAIALCDALMAETLERRFDRAFGVTRPEEEWDRRLSDAIVAQLETTLSTAFEAADMATNRERLLEQQLRELGVEPWALPGDEDNEADRP